MTDKPGVGVENSNHVKVFHALERCAIFVRPEVEGCLLENGISEFHVSTYTFGKHHQPSPQASNKIPEHKGAAFWWRLGIHLFPSGVFAKTCPLSKDLGFGGLLKTRIWRMVLERVKFSSHLKGEEPSMAPQRRRETTKAATEISLLCVFGPWGGH